MKEFYVRVKSTDSIKKYPQNTSAEFEVGLPMDLHLHGYGWMCGITEIAHPVSTKQPLDSQIAVISSFVAQSIINDEMMSVMRRFPNTRPYDDGVIEKEVDHAFSAVEYIRVVNDHLSHLKFRLVTDTLDTVKFEEGTTYITLHFIQNNY